MTLEKPMTAGEYLDTAMNIETPAEFFAGRRSDDPVISTI
jgi:hypothetical protein